MHAKLRSIDTTTPPPERHRVSVGVVLVILIVTSLSTIVRETQHARAAARAEAAVDALAASCAGDRRSQPDGWEAA